MEAIEDAETGAGGWKHEKMTKQVMNARRHEVGLLLYFEPRAEVKRKVFDNRRKKYRVSGAVHNDEGNPYESVS